MAEKDKQNQEPVQKETETKERVVEKEDKSSSLITLIIGIVVILLIGWLILSVLDTTDGTAPEPTPETETTPDATNDGGDAGVDADVNVEDGDTSGQDTLDEEQAQ